MSPAVSRLYVPGVAPGNHSQLGRPWAFWAFDLEELVAAYVADRVLNELLDRIEGIRFPKTNGPRTIVVGQRAVERYTLRELALVRCPPEPLWIGDLVNDGNVHLTTFRSGDQKSVRARLSQSYPPRCEQGELPSLPRTRQFSTARIRPSGSSIIRLASTPIASQTSVISSKNSLAPSRPRYWLPWPGPTSGIELAVRVQLLHGQVEIVPIWMVCN